MKYVQNVHTGTVWPRNVLSSLSSNLPIRGPTAIAPVKASIPPTIWTTPLPAKS